VEEQTARSKMLNVKLETDRKFVFNSHMALHVCRRLLQETGASNFGFSKCMGHEQIAMLDTPACLTLSLANDEGYTAYCHTDLSHTLPGVLLRWTASGQHSCATPLSLQRPVFVAHCQSPPHERAGLQPATIMTHYESDYGAACKTHYQRSEVTVVVPNLRCTNGRHSVAALSPRRRIRLPIPDGNRHRRRLETPRSRNGRLPHPGRHGDYIREIGYAPKSSADRSVAVLAARSKRSNNTKGFR
jgi:hypothetical protein